LKVTEPLDSKSGGGPIGYNYSMSFTLILAALLVAVAAYFTQSDSGIKQLAAMKQSIGINDINNGQENHQEEMNKLLDKAKRDAASTASGLLNGTEDETQALIRKSVTPTLNGKPLNEALPDATKLDFH